MNHKDFDEWIWSEMRGVTASKYSAYDYFKDDTKVDIHAEWLEDDETADDRGLEYQHILWDAA